MAEPATPEAPNYVERNGLRMLVLVQQRPRDIYMLNGEENIVPVAGAAYVVELQNTSKDHVRVVCRIDGVDIDPYTYIVPPAGRMRFVGWYKNESLRTEFRFAQLKKVDVPLRGEINTDIGIIEVEAQVAVSQGPAPKTFDHGDNSGPSTKKSIEVSHVNPKKSDIITGEGNSIRQAPASSSKEIWHSVGDRIKLRVRYNAIQVPPPKGELAEAIDYE